MSEQQEQPKKEKKKPENLVIPPNKPKLSKAERRALQEAQRAAKAGGGATKQPQQTKQEPQAKKSDTKQQDVLLSSPTQPSSQLSHRESLKNIQDDMAFSLFSHLPPYRDPPADEFHGVVLGNESSVNNCVLHPAVLKLGLQYAQGLVRGGNARCRHMLQVYALLIEEYDPPCNQIGDLRPHLDSTILKPAFTYWTTQCRPHSVSMGNAFSFLKSAVASLQREISLVDLKQVLLETIDAYMRERMEFADKAIASHVSPKIVNGDVLLVYGYSEVILLILKTQKELDKDFRVIVVDSRPLLEGKRMLRALRQEANIECTYILLNAVSYVMKDVTKVLLGASALMSNGSVLGRVGTATVALSAQRNTVLVCCETYKISSRVQLESITGNELGDPKLVFDSPPHDNLRMLNLLYDLTPADYISGIVTEMGILPPTSVAVLLREMNPHETADSMNL